METSDLNIYEERIPNIFICECGATLKNHYRNQIAKHRISKKHLLGLLKIIKDLEKDKVDKEIEENKKGSITLDFN
tara:strand:+ start:598 stop:825 length:228 start_codon:yes stop_codon:yes gene_type:complete